MSIVTVGLVVVGLLAGRVPRGWLAVPVVLVAAPIFWTVIGAFDDGEGLLARAAVGVMGALSVWMGWFVGLPDPDDDRTAPAAEPAAS